MESYTLCSASTLPAIPCRLGSRGGFIVSLRAVYRPFSFHRLVLVFLLLSFSSGVIGGYLDFLAVDWSRTVSASRPIFLVFSVPSSLSVVCCLFPSLLLGVPLLTSPWAVFARFLSIWERWWVLRPPLLFLLPRFPCPSFVMFSRLVASSLPLLLCLFGFLLSSGSVPGLSGRRLVQVSSTPPLSPPRLGSAFSSWFPCSPLPLPQQVFQCGTSGRRLVRGITPLVPLNITIWHCLWP